MTTEDELRRTLQRRADGVRPDPEGWSKIAARLEERPARSWVHQWGPRLAAAALVVAVAATALVVRTDDAQDVEGGGLASPPSSVVDGPAAPTALPAAVWPAFTEGELQERAEEFRLANPETAAQSYVAERYGVSVDQVEVDEYQAGDDVSGQVGYRIEGMASAGEVFVRRTFTQAELWYVAGSATESLPVHMAMYDGTDVSLEVVTPTALGGSLVVTYTSVAAGRELSVETISSDGGAVTVAERVPSEPGVVVLLQWGVEHQHTAVAEVRVDAPRPGEPGGGCSAAGLESTTRPQDGLPIAVAETRQRIVAAAVACDYDALAELAAPPFDYTFGGPYPGGPGEFWRYLESTADDPDPGVLEALVELFDRPYGTTEVEGDTWYVWPSAFTYDSWSDVPAEDREALRPLYGDDGLDSFEEFGAYIGYRIAIDENGRWQYFIAGD